MTSKIQIDDFLSHRKLALIRSSRKIKVNGVPMDKQLNANGYVITVVYLDEKDETKKLSSLSALVEGAIIAVPLQQSELAIKDVVAAKIPRVWMQSGCASPEAIALCNKSGIPAIHGECVLMYAEPVTSFHRFHRWIWKKCGKFAK